MGGNGDRWWLFWPEISWSAVEREGGNNFELEREKDEWSRDVLSVFHGGKKEEGH